MNQIDEKRKKKQGLERLERMKKFGMTKSGKEKRLRKAYKIIYYYVDKIIKKKIYSSL